MPGAQSTGNGKQQEGQGGYRVGLSEDIHPLTLLSLGVLAPAHPGYLWPWTSFGGSFCLEALRLWLRDLHSPAATLAWTSALHCSCCAPLRVGTSPWQHSPK